MADIKKNLVLTAELDTSQIKNEIRKLQKELSSGTKIDTSSLADFKKELKAIAKVFASELKKELKGTNISSEISKPSARTMAAGKRLAATNADIIKHQREQALGRVQHTRTQDKDFLFYQNLRRKNETQTETDVTRRLDPRRGRYTNLKEGESYSPLLGKKFDNREDRAATLKAVRREQRIQRERKRHLDDSLKDEEKRRLAMARKFTDLLKSGTSRIFGRSMGTFAGEKVGRAMSSRTAAAGLAGRALGSMGGAALGVGAAAGALYGGASYIRGSLETQRQQRGEIARAQFEQANLTAQDRVLEAPMRQGARQKMGFWQKGAASITGAFGGLMRGAPIQGIKAAVKEEGRLEGDVAVQEAGPLINAAQQNLLPNIQDRIRTMAGGNLTPGQLNDMQMTGGQFGFGIGETNERLRNARETLGGKTFSGEGGNRLFGDMAGMERRMGINTGEQAQFMEMLRGFQGGGTTAGNAFLQQKEIIKSGMAAGIDASKTSKFLQTTSEYVTSNAGMANMDINRQVQDLASLSGAFAKAGGRADATENDIRRARDLQQMLRNESVSTGGIAGIGNFLAIQQAAKESGTRLGAGEFMSLQNMSRDATQQDVMSALKDSDMTDQQKQAFSTKFMENRQKGSFEMGADALGLDQGFRTAFRGQERGMTSEQVLGAERARQLQPGILDDMSKANVALPEGPIGTDEFNTQMQRANVEIVQFNAAFKDLNTINEQYRRGLLDLVTALGEARDKLQEFVPDSRRNPSPQAPRQDDGEGSARGVRGMRMPNMGGR